jgi:hypothetical protein
LSIAKKEMTEFNKFLRKNRLPSSREMSCRSIKEYEKQHGKITSDKLKKNFSEILTECIQIEYRMFQEIINDLRESWASDLLKERDRYKKFPTISKISDDVISCLTSSSSPEEMFSKITKLTSTINDGVSFGQKQAAKTRAGEAFQNYLEHFFDILDFKYDRQKAIKSGEVLDIIFPDLPTLKKKPADCIMMECQTTLKDRFRLSLGKGQELQGIARFIATMTGASVITERDKNDLSKKKIAEIGEKHWRLVALKQVAQKHSSDTIISFEEFVNKQYSSRSGLW